MHSHALLQQGVDPRHINTIAGWREAHRFFSPRERAALAWAEAVNAIPHRTPSDAEFAELREHFKDNEIAELTFAIGAIRAWNMLNASLHTPVPEQPYVSKH
jgi:alkylhydroperoxidase family enzyme